MAPTKRKTRSPLDGLRRAVERGEVEIRPPTADERERWDLVREIRDLAELLRDTYKEWDVGIFEHADGTFSVSRYDCRDERSLSMDHDGNVKLTTWKTSGHNGDPYGEETRDIEPGEAKELLRHLRGSLIDRAVSHEERRLREAHENRFRTAAQTNVLNRLKHR